MTYAWDAIENRRVQKPAWRKYFVVKIVERETIQDFDLGPLENPLGREYKRGPFPLGKIVEGLPMKVMAAKAHLELRHQLNRIKEENGHGQISIIIRGFETDPVTRCWRFTATAWMR